MPYKPKKPCKYPGCNRLTDGSYCTEHARMMYRKYNQERRPQEINERYNNDEWRAIRETYIVSHPFCEICRKYGRVVRAAEVHHIKPLAEGGTNAFTNLISLCHHCQARIHAERGDYLGRRLKVYSYDEK